MSYKALACLTIALFTAWQGKGQSVLRPDILNTDAIVRSTEQMPEFAGGIAGWQDFLRQNLNAQLAVDVMEADSNLAKRKVFKERIDLEFIVCEDGGICNIKVLNRKKVHARLAEEAIRVIKLSPAWKPGTQRGEKVKVYFTQPITFLVD